MRRLDPYFLQQQQQQRKKRTIHFPKIFQRNFMYKSCATKRVIFTVKKWQMRILINTFSDTSVNLNRYRRYTNRVFELNKLSDDFVVSLFRFIAQINTERTKWENQKEKNYK